MSKAGFKPDEKTSGGYDTIFQNMLSHKVKLLQIKPSIDNKPPAVSMKALDQFRGKTGKPKTELNQNFSEKIRLRIIEMKNRKPKEDHFCAPPKSATLNISNRSKKPSHDEVEHARRLQLLKSKINEVESKSSPSRPQTATSRPLTSAGRPSTSTGSSPMTANGNRGNPAYAASTLVSKYGINAIKVSQEMQHQTAFSATKNFNTDLIDQKTAEIRNELDNAFDPAWYKSQLAMSQNIRLRPTTGSKPVIKLSTSNKENSVFDDNDFCDLFQGASKKGVSFEQSGNALEKAVSALEYSLEVHCQVKEARAYNSYVDLKKRMVDVIVDYRIYKSSEIQILFEVLRGHPSLNPNNVAQVTKELEEELAMN